MRVVTCAVVLAMAMASAASAADPGSMKSTPGSVQSMPQHKSAAPAKKHMAAMTDRRSQDAAENKVTAQLNEQQVAGNGAMTAPGTQQGMNPQNAQNPK